MGTNITFFHFHFSSSTDQRLWNKIGNYNFSVKPGNTLALNFTFEPDNRIGLNIGIFAELLNNPIISIVTELNYIQKGMKEEVPVTTPSQPDGTGEFVTWDTRIDYINLSAFGKLRLNLGIISPYLIAWTRKLISKLIKNIH